MNNGNVKNVLVSNRFPEKKLEIILLLLYFPFGTILTVIRMFMLLQIYSASFILSFNFQVKKIVLRIMFAVLGIVIVEDKSVSDNCLSPCILISNHVTILDFIPVHILTNCLWPLICDVPSSIVNCLGLKQIPFGTTNIPDQLAGILIDHLKYSKTSILLFLPDVKSETDDFPKQVPIQPVTIKFWRPPLANIKPCVLNSQWYSDILWSFFVPFTIYTIKVNFEVDTSTFFITLSGSNTAKLKSSWYLPIIEQHNSDETSTLICKIESLILDDLKVNISHLIQ